MAKNEQMITQGGSRRSRVTNKENNTQSTERETANELKGYKNSDVTEQEVDTLETEVEVSAETNTQQKSKLKQNKQAENPDKSKKKNDKEENDEDYEELETGIDKLSKGLNKFIKILAFGLFAVVAIAVVGNIRSNKKLEEAEAKRTEYEQYLDGFIVALNEGNKESINNYFSEESLIGEEFEYFQDGVYMENSIKLLQAILSTVSFDYCLTDTGKADAGLQTNLNIKYIDYDELAESVFSDAKGISEGAKAIKTKTQLDKQILKNYCLGYLADEIKGRVGNAKVSYTVNINEEVQDKKVVSRTIAQDVDQKIESLLFESESLTLCYRIMTDAIKGKIEDGMTYSEYITSLDKERLTDGLSDEKNYIKDNQFGVLVKQEEGINKLCGDGTPSNMATIGTEVQSIYKAKVKKKNKKGKTKTVSKNCKILININEIYSGDNAIVYANSISTANRGLSSNLTGKLFIIDYTISNLSNYTFKVKNNMGVVDDFGNQFYSTGKIHGLKESGTLKKKGSITLQYYILCDNLETKYLVYGIDFKKKYPYVWFNAIQSCFEAETSSTESSEEQIEETIE